MTDAVPGLSQVREGNGRLAAVPWISDEAVVILGYTLELATSGLFSASRHLVEVSTPAVGDLMHTQTNAPFGTKKSTVLPVANLRVFRRCLEILADWTTVAGFRRLGLVKFRTGL